MLLLRNFLFLLYEMQVHFLRYMNSLHHDDYSMALENLHRYFDYRYISWVISADISFYLLPTMRLIHPDSPLVLVLPLPSVSLFWKVILSDQKQTRKIRMRKHSKICFDLRKAMMSWSLHIWINLNSSSLSSSTFI